jgi:hypothetical protein
MTSSIVWTEADKAMVAQIAAEVVKEITQAHVDACPWGKKYLMDKRFLVGLLLGSGLLGGFGLAELVQQFTGG